MEILIQILAIIVAILLIGVVLIQKSKGGGLSSSFAGSNQIMGVRRTNDFIEKTTWTLASILCILAIVSAFVVGGNDNDNSPSVLKAAPAQQAPAAQGQYGTDGAAQGENTQAAPAAEGQAAPEAPAAEGQAAPAAPEAPAAEAPAAEGQAASAAPAVPAAEAPAAPAGN